MQKETPAADTRAPSAPPPWKKGEAPQLTPKA